MLSAAGVEVILVVGLAVAGHRGRTAIVGGEACARAVSAVADSAVVDSVGGGSAVFGAKRPSGRTAFSDQVGATHGAHRLEQSRSGT